MLRYSRITPTLRHFSLVAVDSAIFRVFAEGIWLTEWIKPPTVCAAQSLLLPLLVVKDEITINIMELQLLQNTK